jgi:hypothetical protein
VEHTKINPKESGLLHIHLKIPSSVLAGSYHPFVSLTANGDTATIIGADFTVT